MQITENFNDIEFSKTNHKEIPNIIPLFYIHNIYDLANMLQIIRDEFGMPIIINSGYRSPELNAIVKGSPTSEHLTGRAADITSSNNQLLWEIIIQLRNKGKIEWGQLINEHNFSWIHISLPSDNHYNEVFSIT